jgi:rhamnulose-1-phosphate aldolase
MSSILKGRPALKAEIENTAEVAGYPWQNGWAERNGGNITVNITAYVGDDLHRRPNISERLPTDFRKYQKLQRRLIPKRTN